MGSLTDADYDQFKAFIEKNAQKGITIVMETNKDGNFKGDNRWSHLVDQLTEVKAGKATSAGRFGGSGEFNIFNDTE